MLSFLLPMFPFILPALLAVILLCGLRVRDAAFRLQELNAGKVTPRLP
ncbi:MAG TPA: hypothetical protein VKV37_09635 [Ktedonobacteraceae bacterium]|jgi:hypothetical protein|nr:hypothetical protein [Ktedonobacteraceae bacterium]